MSRQLRLDVAQLTDVGRKRPHNEDNMAYVIPKDPQVMAKKGALFIVADGMGGHAAGEVASEIAVDTVSNVYYEDENDDVITSLLHSIRRANTLIHQRAAENMLRSGMGTTCVAAVLRGSTAYIANVGDSRAYLIRRGAVKQVSQDHSWVEEQVRAGLLTRDQARSHAQRNVITRSLGTQPEVEIDVFSEQLEEGDSMILCTDGLSGLVGDDELGAIVDQYVPQESVYHLVERANENGGSDNITAIVIRVLEVGFDPPGARRPVSVGGREASNEDTAILGRLPNSSPMGLPTRPIDGHYPTAPLRISSGPLGMPEHVAAPQPAQPSARRSRNRLLYLTLALFLLLVLALIGGVGYYFLRLSRPLIDVDSNLSQARALVNQAHGEATTNPSDALQKLAHAQTLLNQVQSASLSDQQRAQMNTLLQGDFTTTVKTAITTYNQQASLTALPCNNNPTSAPINTGSTNTQSQNLVAVHNSKGQPFFYVLGADHAIYQLNDQHSLVNKTTLPGNNAQAVSMAADDTLLLVLASTPGTQKNASTTYTLYVFQPNAQGQLGKAANSTTIDPAQLKGGLTPQFVTAWQDDVYVVLTPQAAPASATIQDYTLNKNAFKGAPRNASIELSVGITDVAAFPNHQLFFLLGDGSVQSLLFNGGNQSLVSVVMQQPILAPLSVAAGSFTPRMTVPTPQAQSAHFLAVPRATLLAAGTMENVPHVYVADPLYNRVLDLVIVPPPAATGKATPTPTSAGAGGGVGSPVNMQLRQQYVSINLLAGMKSLAVDPTGTGVYLLAQNAQTNGAPGLLTLDTRQQNACQQ